MPLYVPAAGGGWTTEAKKTIDETLASSTTMQDDNDIFFTIGASATEIWFFEIFLRIGAANTTHDIKLGWATVPLGATIRWGEGFVAGAARFGFAALATTASPASPNSETTVLGAGLGLQTNNFIGLSGWVFGGGTAGNIRLQWAQNTSDAGVLTMSKGSWLRAQKLVA